MEDQVATQNRLLRIVAMDDRGYSHKPLARVDITNESVLDAIEDWWDMYGFYRERINNEEYACWMTDPEDLCVDEAGKVGTSCVTIQGSGRRWVIERYNGVWWSPAFKNTHGTFFEHPRDEVLETDWDDSSVLKSAESFSTFNTFDKACRVAEKACAWESNNRKMLAEFRTQQITEDSSAKWNKDKKKAYLIKATGGMLCWGCGRKFDNVEYLHVDHIRPRADGGADSLYNLALLCQPCNGPRRKGAKLTLTGLRDRNRKGGFMVREIDIPQIGFVFITD